MSNSAPTTAFQQEISSPLSTPPLIPPERPPQTSSSHNVSPTHDDVRDHPTRLDQAREAGPGVAETLPIQAARTEQRADPHDLAFSPRHVTRASVLENMVMALDQFSNHPMPPSSSPLSSTTAPATLLSHSARASDPRYPSHQWRRRANTVSSEASSDNDARIDPNLAYLHSSHRHRVSNGASPFTFPTGLQPILNLQEEETARTRERSTDPPNATAFQGQRHPHLTAKSSASSIVELGTDSNFTRARPEHSTHRPTHSRDLDAPPHRTYLPREDSQIDETWLMLDQIEAAPTPVVHGGPSRGHSPIRQSPSAPWTTPVLDSAASNSRPPVKSSKSPQHHHRKQRARAMTGSENASTKEPSRSQTENPDDAPPIPSYLAPTIQSPLTLTSRNPSFSSRLEMPSPGPTPSKERPGFFRRVFGTKNAAATGFPLTPNAEGGTAMDVMCRSPTGDSVRASAWSARLHGLPIRETNASSPAVLSKEPPHLLTKKSSAFFRRRKKSISDVAPEPMHLPRKSSQLDATEPELGGSSLRQAMDNYLTDTAMPSPPPQPGSSHEPWSGSALTESGSSRPHEILPASEDAPPQLTNQPDRTKRELAVSSAKVDVSGSIPPNHRRDDQNEPKLAATHHEPGPFGTSPRSHSPAAPSTGHSQASGSGGSRHTSRGNDDAGPSATSSTLAQTTGSEAKESPKAVPSSTTPIIGRPRPGVLKSSSRPSNLTLPPQSSDGLLGGSSIRNRSDGTSRGSTSPSGSEHGAAQTFPTPPMTLITQDQLSSSERPSPCISVTPSSTFIDRNWPTDDEDYQQALKIFQNRADNIESGEASAWLGDAGQSRERVRMAYMGLFDWTNMDMLAALRGLCERIVLKGETQQVDRMLEAFSRRWCQCNVNHGFRSFDVVHTICYSVLLLNTDLHLAEVGQKMTRAQFVRNTLPTIQRIAVDSTIDDSAGPKSAASWSRSESILKENRPPMPRSPSSPLESFSRRNSVDDAARSARVPGRPPGKLRRQNSSDVDPISPAAGWLVSSPALEFGRAWDFQIENVLKNIYNSIARERLPLSGAMPTSTDPAPAGGHLLNFGGNLLRRSPSTLSKAASDHSRGRLGENNRLNTTGRWASKPRSRSQFHTASTQGSTRTSVDEGSSGWSPSINSTWSKVSGARTLTSVSVDSLGSDGTQNDFQKSIGFANALNQAIIREDSTATGGVEASDGVNKVPPLLNDEALGLSGAPWAKEGSLKHKHQSGGVDRRSKSRNWNDCFAVIEKGWMRLFSFSVTAKSLRAKAKDRTKAGAVVGGGNWMDNAEEVAKFLLHHAIASALPQPGYSKARPFVWALSLPTGALHLFQVGTPDIVQEFVSTANYWSARLSKEPMSGGVSNMEYGWSDQVINQSLIGNDASSHAPLSGAGRPSLQSSVRSSSEPRASSSGGGGGSSSSRPRRAGDKVTIHEWRPPQQSMMASQLMEVDQLHALQTYVQHVEEELGRHNELRAAMELAFSPRHANTGKAMANWEHKSKYLLREIVKFKTYSDSLLFARREKEKLTGKKEEEEEGGGPPQPPSQQGKDQNEETEQDASTQEGWK